MNVELIFLITYILNAAFLSILLFAATFNLYSSAPDLEKFSTYECGFMPLSNARSRFDIKFYVVAILFIVFDIEIAFLFPWIVIAKQLTGFETLGVAIFLIILTVGFVYEWASGALYWH
jgi:NADH:ubiquinone oxidoreductase subunit 3 (subunit A)